MEKTEIVEVRRKKKLDFGDTQSSMSQMSQKSQVKEEPDEKKKELAPQE